MSIRVLVADDQDIVRTGLAMILDAQPGIEVVGEAADGREAIRLAHELRPDIVLLDVQLPDLDGFAVAGRLATLDGPTVILISSREAHEFGGQVEASQADGFIPKSDLSGAAIRNLLR